MNHRIALCACSWVTDIISELIRGITDYCKPRNIDLFFFDSHAVANEDLYNNTGELNIHNLPDFRDFDAVIVASNILNSNEKVEEIVKRANELNVPVASIALSIEGAAFCNVNNDIGMGQLMDHLIKEHGVKKVSYIAGTKEHVDSNERLDVIRKKIEEIGGSVTEKDVFYSNWSFSNIIAFMDQILDNKEDFPDAILCANDLNALAVISELSSRGIQVPEDVIVTGFDFIGEGKHFYPALTTVSQDYYKVGYECCKSVLEEGPVPVKDRSVKIMSRFIAGESCGCRDDFCFEELRRKFCQKLYAVNLREDLLRVFEQNRDNQIAHSKDYEELKKNLEDFYVNNHLFEGNDFAIVFDKRYFFNLLEEENGLHMDSYEEKLDVLFAMKDGKVLRQDEVDRHELMPGYVHGDESDVYSFLPIYVEEHSLGYVAIKGRPLVLQKGRFFPYVRELKQSLLRLRINMRLDTLNSDLMEIYNRDPMTGLYNRFVMDDVVIPVFEECIANKKEMAIFFVDINYMKKINDRFGHLRGDEAIKMVSASIKDVLEEEWMAVRYGGDEFLIVAPGADKETAENAKWSIIRDVDSKAMKQELPYHLGISIGYVITEPETEKSFEDYIKMADDLMYEIKRELHAKD